MSIRAIERDTYETAWALPQYAVNSPAVNLQPLLLDLLQPVGTVLDAGCGSGKGAVALAAAGYDVTLCDLTAEGLVPEAQALPFVEACLWDDLVPLGYLASLARHDRETRFDWVVCCDVLEHVPTAFTMLVIRRLLDVAKKGVFLSIALAPDHMGVLVGHPLHLTVQPYDWWRDALAELAILNDARDLQNVATFLLTPKEAR